MNIASTNWKKIIGVAVLGLSLALVGCGGPKDEEGAVPSAAGADSGGMGDSDSGSANGLQTINFPYDSYSLGGSTKRKLKANAQILQDSPSMAIQIEGHCDERGSIQYNLALGEKRAKAVRNYLIDMGIARERIDVISMGEERPIASGANDSAWGKNRRANFVITAN